jgi:hypothetical protein
MSNVATCSQHRRCWWLLTLVLLVPVAVITGIWLTRPADEPGFRTRIVWPGGPAAVAASAGGQRLEIEPALLAEAIQVKLGAMSRGEEAVFVFCREECRQEVIVTAGPQALRSANLHYTLFDAKGAEIGAGALFPDEILQPNAEGSFIIGDFALDRTAKIVIGK